MSSSREQGLFIKVFEIKRGIAFLGFRVFYYHKLLKKSNIMKFRRKLEHLCSQFDDMLIDYDKIYDFLEGWIAYSNHANTYKLRKKMLKSVEHKFEGEISTKEYNRYLRIGSN